MANNLTAGTNFVDVTGQPLQKEVENNVNATQYILLLDYTKGNGTSVLINLICFIDSGTTQYYYPQIDSSQVVSKWQRVFSTTGKYVLTIDLPTRCTKFRVEAAFTGGDTQILDVSGVANDVYYNRR